MTPDNIHYTTYLWQKTAHFFEIKAVLGFLLATFAFLFDQTATHALLGLFLLINIDFILGVGAAYKNKEEIESLKVLRTALKITVYFTLVAAVHMGEAALPIFRSFLDETVTGFLVATELVSILENTGRLGFAVPKQLLNKLEDYTTKN